MLLTEPLSQIHQLAATGTKRPELSREPIAALFADRASDFARRFHFVSPTITFMSATIFATSPGATPADSRLFVTPSTPACSALAEGAIHSQLHDRIARACVVDPEKVFF